LSGLSLAKVVKVADCCKKMITSYYTNGKLPTSSSLRRDRIWFMDKNLKEPKKIEQSNKNTYLCGEKSK
jgi:hypothetical protein